MKKIKTFINDLVVSTFTNFGYTIVKTRHPEISDIDWKLYEQVRPLTMTPPDRIYSLMEAMQYIVNSKVEGDIVECGVWRGGNAVLASTILFRNNDTLRKLWLYDTFDGMVAPDDVDTSSKGEIAKEIFEKNKNAKGGSSWSFASFDFVSKVIQNLDYPTENFKMIQGKVEDTLIYEENVPQKIALLRLDTDWYSSTKMEMEVLYPKLVKGGILIIDDYGDWKGSKKAVDEYFESNNIRIPLIRLGSGARIAIKY